MSIRPDNFDSPWLTNLVSTVPSCYSIDVLNAQRVACASLRKEVAQGEGRGRSQT